MTAPIPVGARSLTRRGVLTEVARATLGAACSSFVVSGAADEGAGAGGAGYRGATHCSDAQPKPSAPVAVFVLAGQSNMEGHGILPADPARSGGKGSLEHLARDPATAGRFARLLDPATGKWRARDDVFLSSLDRRGPLTPGFGAGPDRIGPEVGFG
ncbi:MAG: sialate O-acetylesterase, partial [Armatimonadetes bacterium]|nr:sialate O-acetylesterase [Armatimonadota bacterium]